MDQSLMAQASSGRPFLYNGVWINRDPADPSSKVMVYEKGTDRPVFIRSMKQFNAKFHDKVPVVPKTPEEEAAALELVAESPAVSKNDVKSVNTLERMKQIYAKKQEAGWNKLSSLERNEWSQLKTQLINDGVITEADLKAGRFPEVK